MWKDPADVFYGPSSISELQGTRHNCTASKGHNLQYFAIDIFTIFLVGINHSMFNQDGCGKYGVHDQFEGVTYFTEFRY